MQRHVEIGIILPDHARDEHRRGLERIEMDDEFAQIPGEPDLQHLMRALAHRLRGKKRERGGRAGIVGRCDGQNSSILRPTTALRSSSVGDFVRRKIAGGFLGFHLDLGVVGDQRIRDRHAFADLDAG